MKSFLKLSFLLLLTACASKHVGRPGKPVSGYQDLKISAERIADYSDETNQFYSVTIENTGSDWLRVDETDLAFPETENSPHRLVVGKDLHAWFLANQERAELREQNNRFINEGIAWASVGVMVAGVGTKNKDLTTAGAVGVLGASAMSTSDALIADRNKAQRSKLVPDSHLYSSFIVPSNGFIRKWFLIHTPQKKYSETTLVTLKSVEGEVSQYELPLKPGQYRKLKK